MTTKEYYRAWYQKNKEKRIAINAAYRRRIRERIAKIKVERGCVDCGYNASHHALDFDHLRDKEFSLGAAQSVSWERVVKEIEKCEVVCANCHRVRTAERMKASLV